MARPTDEKKDKTIKLRISEELYADLITRGPNMSETIRNIIKGGNKSSESFVPQNEIEKVVDELGDMASCCGIPLDNMVHQVYGMLEDGRIEIVNGTLGSKNEDWVDNFKEACRDRGVPVEKAAESAIKALKRGGL